MKIRFLLPVFAALLSVGAARAAAQAPEVLLEPAAEARAREAMSQLRSPVTVYHTLDMCPDPAAAALRDTVRMAVQRGDSPERIVEDVVARRGERLRLAPRQEGAGLWAWLAPPAVLLLGLAVVGGKLRRMRRRDGPYTPAAATPLSTDERASLDAALREYEGAEEAR